MSRHQGKSKCQSTEDDVLLFTEETTSQVTTHRSNHMPEEELLFVEPETADHTDAIVSDDDLLMVSEGDDPLLASSKPSAAIQATSEDDFAFLDDVSFDNNEDAMPSDAEFLAAIKEEAAKMGMSESELMAMLDSPDVIFDTSTEAKTSPVNTPNTNSAQSTDLAQAKSTDESLLFSSTEEEPVITDDSAVVGTAAIIAAGQMSAAKSQPAEERFTSATSPQTQQDISEDTLNEISAIAQEIQANNAPAVEKASIESVKTQDSHTAHIHSSDSTPDVDRPGKVEPKRDLVMTEPDTTETESSVINKERTEETSVAQQTNTDALPTIELMRNEVSEAQINTAESDALLSEERTLKVADDAVIAHTDSQISEELFKIEESVSQTETVELPVSTKNHDEVLFADDSAEQEAVANTSDNKAAFPTTQDGTSVFTEKAVQDDKGLIKSAHRDTDIHVETNDISHADSSNDVSSDEAVDSEQPVLAAIALDDQESQTSEFQRKVEAAPAGALSPTDALNLDSLDSATSTRQNQVITPTSDVSPEQFSNTETAILGSAIGSSIADNPALLPDINSGHQELARLAFFIGQAPLMVPLAEGNMLLDIPELFKLPNTARWFLGYSNINGVLVPIFDVEDFLGIDADNSLESSNAVKKLLVVTHEEDAAGIIINSLPKRVGLHHAKTLTVGHATSALMPYLANSYQLDEQIWYDLNIYDLLNALEQRVQA